MVCRVPVVNRPPPWSHGIRCHGSCSWSRRARLRGRICLSSQTCQNNNVRISRGQITGLPRPSGDQKCYWAIGPVSSKYGAGEYISILRNMGKSGEHPIFGAGDHPYFVETIFLKFRLRVQPTTEGLQSANVMW